jgi:IS605 OrfB family transposase
MYNIQKDKKGKNWIAIASLEPRKMIKLPLTDDRPIRGNLNIQIQKNRIIITESQDEICKPIENNKSTKVVAMDKGITNIVNTSEDTKYGENFSKTMTEFSDRRSEKNKQRYKLMALVEKYEGDEKKHKKLNNIKKYNLGTVKYNILTDYERKELERQINEALNEFFFIEKPSTMVTEILDFSSWRSKLSRNQRRHFSEWLKGFLNGRIRYKCQQNGVLLAEVNPAFTSQTCPFCGYVHKGNRRGGKFHCLFCGREGDADYFAALNILSRLYDPDIGRYTPYQEVRLILMRRFRERQARDGRGVTVETVQPGLQTHSSGRLAVKNHSKPQTTLSLGERIS